jgi:hypothetical protein
MALAFSARRILSETGRRARYLGGRLQRLPVNIVGNIAWLAYLHPLHSLLSRTVAAEAAAGKRGWQSSASAAMRLGVLAAHGGRAARRHRLRICIKHRQCGWRHH